MRLFHGTSTEHLDRILSEGIQPRKTIGRVSNWDDEIPTRQDYVWLTSAYAIYYASAAAKEEHDAVLIEVDIDLLPDLYPDEDWVASQKSDGTNESWREWRAKIDPKHWKALWIESLKQSGNICCRQVPKEAIIDHRVIPIEGNSMLLLNTGVDVVPNDASYPYLGSQFRKYLAAYFDYDLSEMPDQVKRINDDYYRDLLGEEEFEQMQRSIADQGFTTLS